MNWDKRELHRKRNYDICTAIDLIKLGIILEEMEQTGDLDQMKSKNFHNIASSLLYIIRKENDKLLGEKDIEKQS